MQKTLIAVSSAAMIALATIASPNQAQAQWHRHGYGHGGWWVPGAVIGGLALGAAIASRPYYGYGYSYGPRPYYGGYGYDYGGVGPYDYEYNSGGPYYYQRSYRYSGPYRHWTEF